ncbi:MAG: hypothetical protein ACFFKA_11980 [Candidatus Thorarchaeota archaeon]
MDWAIIAVLLPWNLSAILILIFGKKYLTIPRLGYVKFGEKRKKAKLRLFIFLSANIVVALLLPTFAISGFFSALPLNTSIQALLIGILLITLPLSILGFILEFFRLLVYALLSGLGFYFTELSYLVVGEPFDVFLSFGSIGIVIIIIGFVYLIQFKHRYPLKRE